MSSLKLLLKKLTLNKTPYFLFLFVAIVGLDQFFKSISAFIKTDSFLGLSIERALNHGFLFSLRMGSFSFIESFFTVFVFSFGVLAYFSFLYFLPKAFVKTRWGLTFVFAGAISNMANKILHSHVVDFIRFKFNSIAIYFNIADIAQTIGWGIIIYEIIIFRKIIWRALEQRKVFIVLKKEQYSFILYSLWIALCTFLFISFIGLDFLNKMHGAPDLQQDQIVALFPRYAIYMMVAFLIPVFVLAIYFSNKIYGPIYAFEKHLKALINNEPSREFKLREGDQLKRLEKMAQSIAQKLKK